MSGISQLSVSAGFRCPNPPTLGSYRRGKEESNDVDILITFPHAEGVERGVLCQLVQRLSAKGARAAKPTISPPLVQLT